MLARTHAKRLPLRLSSSGLCFHWAAMVGPTGPVYDKPVSRQGSASRQYRGRRRATAVGWRDRVEWEPPWQAAPQMGDRASADSLRWNLDLILDQRGADVADLPGGASGLLARDFKGKEADRLGVW